MTPDQVAALFLASSLTPIIGDANYEQFKQTRSELVAILAQIPSPLGGGNHGLICLAFKPSSYKTETKASFERPEKHEAYDPTIDKTIKENEHHKKHGLWVVV